MDHLSSLVNISGMSCHSISAGLRSGFFDSAILQVYISFFLNHSLFGWMPGPEVPKCTRQACALRQASAGMTLLKVLKESHHKHNQCFSHKHYSLTQDCRRATVELLLKQLKEKGKRNTKGQKSSNCETRWRERHGFWLLCFLTAWTCCKHRGRS